MSVRSGERNRVPEGAAYPAAIAVAIMSAAVLIVAGIVSAANDRDPGSRFEWERVPSSSDRVLEIPRVYVPDNSVLQGKSSGSATGAAAQSGNADDSASTGGDSAASAADDSAVLDVSQPARSSSAEANSPNSTLGSVDDYENEQAGSIASGRSLMVIVPMTPMAGNPYYPPAAFGAPRISMSPAYAPWAPMMMPAGGEVIPLSKPPLMPGPGPKTASRPITTMPFRSTISAGRSGFRFR